MTTDLRESLAPRTRLQALTSVWCQYGLCPYLLKKGKPRLVGRIWGRAELACPACRQIAIYEVRV